MAILSINSLYDKGIDDGYVALLISITEEYIMDSASNESVILQMLKSILSIMKRLCQLAKYTMAESILQFLLKFINKLSIKVQAHIIYTLILNATDILQNSKLHMAFNSLCNRFKDESELRAMLAQNINKVARSLVGLVAQENIEDSIKGNIVNIVILLSTQEQSVDIILDACVCSGSKAVIAQLLSCKTPNIYNLLYRLSLRKLAVSVKDGKMDMTGVQYIDILIKLTKLTLGSVNKEMLKILLLMLQAMLQKPFATSINKISAEAIKQLLNVSKELSMYLMSTMSPEQINGLKQALIK
jgi:hypothetical protein